MKLLPFLLILLLPFLSTAQEKFPDRDDYHYRKEITTPAYGLAKIQALIETTRNSQKTDDTTVSFFFDHLELSDDDYNELSLKEKFTYTMIHAEWFSQNCNYRLSFRDNKIPGYLPDIFDLRTWSIRQRNFLSNNRDAVMRMIEKSAENSKRLGLNYKHAIIEIKGQEMIPFLVKFYNRDHKDIDILSVLMQLMREAKYSPFAASDIYAQLYGPESRYTNSLVFSKANEELIIKHATDFYNSRN